VARGGEPKAVLRDPARNIAVELPVVGRDHFVKGYSLTSLNRARVGTPGVIVRDDFVFQAGQPEAVRIAYRKAMGLTDDLGGGSEDRPLN